jgi:glycyl-tRNA synthetase beta chain
MFLDFLLEIGIEEIPARMIDDAANELGCAVNGVIGRGRLGGSTTTIFSTPRRLAVLVKGVAQQQPVKVEQVTGPPVKAAFKDGQPTAAAHAFAKKAGVAVEQLQRVTTPKGEYLAAQITTPGRSAADVLAAELPKEIAALSWPKAMYWRAGKPERFVRPIRWIVALLDSDIIPLEFAGIRAGNISRGHRILHPAGVSIPSAAAYADTMRAASVIVLPDDRRFIIERDADQALLEFGDGASGQRPPTGDRRPATSGSGASGNIPRESPSTETQVSGHDFSRAEDGRNESGALAPASPLRLRPDAALLATTVNLTEFPSVLLGNFDREFLSLPEEVLVTVMRDHQKYFAVETSDGRLAPHFLAVLNTAADPGSADGPKFAGQGEDPAGLIRHGNERVLRARFNDARFFWQTDQKTPLTARVEMLKSVTFQKDLGSYYDKTQRVIALCDRLAEMLGTDGARPVSSQEKTPVSGHDFSRADSGTKEKPASAAEGNHSMLDRGALKTAAELCKTDLTTELVKEFTELQGIVGGLYARAQGLSETIAQAIYHHYQPQSMDDPVPPTLEGALLSLADKADTIAGMFALGLVPSGSKDPFALRRQANGIVKIIAVHQLPMNLGELMENARAGYSGSEAELKFKNSRYSESVGNFLRERIDFYLREFRNLPYDVANAVLAQSADDVVAIVARAVAVNEARASEDFRSVCVAFRRVKNILAQAQEKQFPLSSEIDLRLMTEPEQDLYHDMDLRGVLFNRQAELGNYRDALSTLGHIRPAVDTFFEKVMVMVDDPRVRSNRLALLSRLEKVFRRIADFSEIVTESK